MSIRRNQRKSGQVTYTARVVVGRGGYAGEKTFPTLREARAWEADQRRALEVGGLDAGAGKVQVQILLEEWLGVRRSRVAPMTLVADGQFVKNVPGWFGRVQAREVTPGHVARLLREWGAQVGRDAVVRRRASLSAFFEWLLVECRAVMSNPVRNVRVPRRVEPGKGPRPLSERELVEVAAGVAERGGTRLAEVVLLMGLTGLRPSEARELRVRDVVELPVFGLRISRARPEGHAVKVTKSGRERLVPVPSHVQSIVRSMAQGKQPDDLLVTTDRGGSLHANRFRASSGWDELTDGRRLYDLRHTAICLWLSAGVPVSTVKEWAGHADISTTNVYVTFLGTDADRVGVARLEGVGVASEQDSAEGNDRDA
ncbi:hypothetical protein GCM10008944_21810 [Cytobacillus oceanisediminis]